MGILQKIVLQKHEDLFNKAPKNLRLWHNNNQEVLVNVTIVEHCAGVTPKSTQRASKLLFQPGLVIYIIF